jgi:hypothetical protein
VIPSSFLVNCVTIRVYCSHCCLIVLEKKKLDRVRPKPKKVKKGKKAEVEGEGEAHEAAAVAE